MSERFDRRAGVDCCLWVADWIALCTGIDPAANLRGAYVGAAGAARLIRFWGGFDAMWRVHMALAGFVTTRAPVEGDVGVVRDAGDRLVAAIRVGEAHDGTWAAKGAHGLVIEDFPTRAAWAVMPRTAGRLQAEPFKRHVGGRPIDG